MQALYHQVILGLQNTHVVLYYSIITYYYFTIIWKVTSWSPGFSETTSLQRGEGSYDRQQKKGRATLTLLHLILFYSICNCLVEVINITIVVSAFCLISVITISHIHGHHSVYGLCAPIGSEWWATSLHKLHVCLHCPWWRTDTKVANIEWDVEPKF